MHMETNPREWFVGRLHTFFLYMFFINLLQRNRFCRHMVGRMRPGMFPWVDTELLKQHRNSLQPEDTRTLVFIEPRTSDPFVWREWTVTRTGFPISHARAITSTACQGRTMRDGVIIDCGRHEAGSHKKEDDDWWLDLYVIFPGSRKDRPRRCRNS